MTPHLGPTDHWYGADMILKMMFYSWRGRGGGRVIQNVPATTAITLNAVHTIEDGRCNDCPHLPDFSVKVCRLGDKQAYGGGDRTIYDEYLVGPTRWSSRSFLIIPHPTYLCRD